MIARSGLSPESPASGDLESPDPGNLPSLPALETAGRGINSAPWRPGIARSGQSPESPASATRLPGDLGSPDQANLPSLPPLETWNRQIQWAAQGAVCKGLSTVVDGLTAGFQLQEEQHRRRPAQLPKALLQPRWRPIKSHGPTNQRLMTAREAAEFGLKQQERAASLKTAPASLTSAPLLGPLNRPRHPTATTRTTWRVRRPATKVQEAQDVAAARGLKRMATAMADWKRHDNNIYNKITHWFEVIDPAMLPENVYNMDETGVMLCMLGSVKVLVSKDDPRGYRGAGVKRTMVTAIECISANAYRDEAERLYRVTNTVGKEHFTSLYSPSREKAFTKRNITAAWAASGLFPFNPDRVLRTIQKPLTQLTIPQAGGMKVGSCLHDEVLKTPVTPVSAEALMSLLNLIKQDAHMLNETSTQRREMRVQKLAH
ncbi:hypothetical protein V500_02625 [Pseudogymnoascus sp. VKM F-4518 (FW-2643)]|nr:hypothetical protein V500_02625 [Pseudogymnoascus sp. VKM F-4518 (FW-2643)]